MALKLNKAVFLDKDGTIIEDVPYNADPKKIKIYPDVPEALYKLKQAGYLLVVVSNQPGVSLGYFKKEQLRFINNEISNQLEPYGVEINEFFYCTHLPYKKNAKDECNCRKPKPGMLLEAQKELNIDFKRSWLIGDILNDVEAGKRVGCKSVLIDNGNETEWIINKWRSPDFKAASFKEAASVILNHKKIKIG